MNPNPINLAFAESETLRRKPPHAQERYSATSRLHMKQSRMIQKIMFAATGQSGESRMAEIYHIKDRRADRGRSEGMKVHDNSSLPKHSASMVSHDQHSRVAREYRFRGTAAATDFCNSIELQDFANRIQEHWRAAHNARHAPNLGGVASSPVI
jgi:hypothetical protein